MNGTAGAKLADGSTAQSSWRRELSEFFATGGLHLVLWPLALAYQHWAGVDRAVYITSYAAAYLAFVINDPHFAVSYMLFYRRFPARLWGGEFQGLQRLRYAISGVIVPLLLCLWIAYSFVSVSAQWLAILIQTMYFLVGWHYVKQGFGVLTVLSARRGIYFDALERRVLLAHCFCGWIYAWAWPREWGAEYNEGGLIYTALAQPVWLEPLSRYLLIASILALSTIAMRRVKRGLKMPPFPAVSGYLLSIWLWMIFANVDPLMSYLIPALHSAQYGYFVFLLKGNESKSEQQIWLNASQAEPAKKQSAFSPVYRRLLFFAASTFALGWLLFHGIQNTLDGLPWAQRFLGATFNTEGALLPSVLGATPYAAAIGAFVNIHHYFLDNVIWRRENRDTRFLK